MPDWRRRARLPFTLSSHSSHSTPSTPSRAVPAAVSSPHQASPAPSSSSSAAASSPYYIPSTAAARASAALRPGDARRLRRRGGLDALTLARALPCARAGWALVRRGGRGVGGGARVFGGGWERVWAELRGGMVLLFAREREVVRDVFVVSDAVVDVRHARAFALLSLRRRDAALQLRVASGQDAQAWVVALATKGRVYRGAPKLTDFVPVSAIGRGASGKVFLVRDRRKDGGGSGAGERLALKIIPKAHVFRSLLTYQHVVNERLVLELTANNPFLVEMRYAFQTPTHLYLATEFYDGGDVFALLQAHGGRLEERHAVRLIAEVIVALQILHDRSIVYRDLKPENVVLDRDGHIRLADFGLAKLLATDATSAVSGLSPASSSASHLGASSPSVTSSQAPSSSVLNARRGGMRNAGIEATTRTVCGTTAYAAPEMLQSKPYGKSLDLWCLGVFSYHVLSGRTPYNFKNRSMPEMYDIQRSRPVRFPSQLSPQAVSFIQSLLQLSPEERPTLNALKEHPFFASVDWTGVARKDPHPDGLAPFVSGDRGPGVCARTSPLSSNTPGERPSQERGSAVPHSQSPLTNITAATTGTGTTMSVSASSAISEPARQQMNVQQQLQQQQQRSNSPIFRHFSGPVGPGSSLRTESSEIADLTDMCGSSGYPEDDEEYDDGRNEMLDEYLLRNINQDEWRNVSFAVDDLHSDAEVTTMGNDFPTLLGSRAKEVETVAIAGWGFISERDCDKRELENPDGNKGVIGADETKIPPTRTLFSRRSLPETFDSNRIPNRRSLGDRRSAAPGSSPNGGLFDVGPDRQTAFGIPRRGAGPGGVGAVGSNRRSLDSALPGMYNMSPSARRVAEPTHHGWLGSGVGAGFLAPPGSTTSSSQAATPGSTGTISGGGASGRYSPPPRPRVNADMADRVTPSGNAGSGPVGAMGSRYSPPPPMWTNVDVERSPPQTRVRSNGDIDRSPPRGRLHSTSSDQESSPPTRPRASMEVERFPQPSFPRGNIARSTSDRAGPPQEAGHQGSVDRDCVDVLAPFSEPGSRSTSGKDHVLHDQSAASTAMPVPAVQDAPRKMMFATSQLPHGRELLHPVAVKASPPLAPMHRTPSSGAGSSAMPEVSLTPLSLSPHASDPGTTHLASSPLPPRPNVSRPAPQPVHSQTEPLRASSMPNREEQPRKRAFPSLNWDDTDNDEYPELPGGLGNRTLAAHVRGGTHVRSSARKSVGSTSSQERDENNLDSSSEGCTSKPAGRVFKAVPSAVARDEQGRRVDSPSVDNSSQSPSAVPATSYTRRMVGDAVKGARVESQAAAAGRSRRRRRTHSSGSRVQNTPSFDRNTEVDESPVQPDPMMPTPSPTNPGGRRTSKVFERVGLRLRKR